MPLESNVGHSWSSVLAASIGHAMRMPHMRLSRELPLELNLMSPVVKTASFTEILTLATGETIIPDNVMLPLKFAADTVSAELAMTVVPSHSLAKTEAAPPVSIKVTVPDTNQVPSVP